MPQIRTLLSGIGLLIALVIAVAVPAGYYAVNSANSAETLAFKAHYGLQDVGTRASLQAIKHRGWLAVIGNPWIYVVVGAAVIGILLSQSAFNAARLDFSLPPITAAEPIAGIALGVSLLGDVVSVSVAGLAVEATCLVAMVAGVVLIGRSQTLSDC